MVYFLLSKIFIFQMKLKLSITGFLVLLFFVFLPFERLLTFEVFGLTAKISFVILMLLVLSFIALRPEPKFETVDKLLLLFATVAYLTAFWSIDQLRSLIIATIFLATFVGFIALRRFITAKNLETVKSIIIYWGFVLCFFALWQYFADMNNLPFAFLRDQYTKIVFGFPRPQGTFLEPLYFANFLFLPFYFSFERFLLSKKINWFLSANIFLMFSVMVLTLSRGAYFAFAVSLLMVGIVIAWKFRELLKRFWIIVGIGVLGIAAAVLLIYNTANKHNFQMFVEHAGVVDVSTGESTLDRFSFSSTAWNNTLRTPWGIGAGAFGALPEFSKKLAAGNYQTVTNLYLEILVEEGIVGLIVFLVFLFLTLKKLWQGIFNKKIESLVLLAVFVAIFIQAVSFSALYIIPIWAFLALVWRTGPYESTN